MNAPTTVVALVGPTGAGKTAVIEHIAAQLDLAVIQADSVQAVRGFDIGSAKPSPALRRRVPHYGIDVVAPTQRYDAWRFRRDAAVWSRDAGARALLATAGTGFYLQAWEQGLAAVGQLPDPERRDLFAHVSADSPSAHAELARIDPQRADAIHPNDWRRIARALEIHALTGRPPSRVPMQTAASPGPRLVKFGLWAEGPAYEARLAERVQQMLAAGWVEEVERLQASHGADLPMFEAVGYRQIVEMLAGRRPAATLADAIVVATRRYAKRQRVWFKRADVRWFPYRPEGPPQALLSALLAALRRYRPRA